jgi:hypothetical protein
MCRTTWRPGVSVSGVQVERLEQREHHPLVLLRLLQVLLPLILQLVVLDASERRLVHSDPALPSRAPDKGARALPSSSEFLPWHQVLRTGSDLWNVVDTSAGAVIVIEVRSGRVR